MSKLITIAVREKGEKKLFSLMNDGYSLSKIAKIVKDELPSAHPVLVGITGGKTTPAGNDGDVEPGVA